MDIYTNLDSNACIRVISIYNGGWRPNWFEFQPFRLWPFGCWRQLLQSNKGHMGAPFLGPNINISGNRRSQVIQGSHPSLSLEIAKIESSCNCKYCHRPKFLICKQLIMKSLCPIPLHCAIEDSTLSRHHERKILHFYFLGMNSRLSLW